MVRRVGRIAVAVAVVGAVVAGCGSGPGQVGSAAIVGPAAVSLSDVQAQLDGALAKKDLVAQYTQGGQGTDQIARDIVSTDVQHELITRAAAAEGIVVTDAQLDAKIAQFGGADAVTTQTFFDASTVREGVRDQMLMIELGKRYADRLSVVIDFAVATTRADAEAKARVVAAGGPAADAVFAADKKANRGMEVRASNELGAIASSQEESTSLVLFGTPQGQVVSFQPSSSQAGWIVMRIVSRNTDSPVAAGASVVDQIDDSTFLQFGRQLLQPLSQELGVRVNPRYGVWDQIRMRVVAPGQEAGSVLVPAPAAP